jgi:uncharacterized protein (UPF0261 family)
MPFWDPSIDRVLTDTLRKVLNPGIPFEEMDVHINDFAFVKRTVDVLDTMMQAA